jgi:hypothetical protein
MFSASPPLDSKLVSKVTTRGDHGLWEPFPEDGQMDLNWHIALAHCLRYWFRFARSQSSCSTEGGIMEAFLESFIMYHINPVLWDPPGKIRGGKNVFRCWEQWTIDSESDAAAKDARWLSDWKIWVSMLPREWAKRVTKEKNNPDVKFWFLMASRDWCFPQVRLEIFLRLHRRNIFITESGHLGIGPSELEEGDLIVLFLVRCRPWF